MFEKILDFFFIKIFIPIALVTMVALIVVFVFLSIKYKCICSHTEYRWHMIGKTMSYGPEEICDSQVLRKEYNLHPEKYNHCNCK